MANISIYEDRKNLGNQKVDDVLIVANLDRGLFSANFSTCWNLQYIES